VIVLVLANAMFTRNRPLTAILFIAAAIEPFYLFSETGSIWRLLLQVAFFVFYARGFVGVFRYHFIAGSSQMPFFARLTIIGLLLILVPLIALGLLVLTQMVPETATITGEELRPNVTRFLIEREIVERDEEVLYAYF